MDLPWDRLGLGSFLAADAEGILWFEAGRPRMGEEPPTQGLPLVAYSEEGAGRGSIDLGLLGRTVLPTLADSSLAGLCTRFSVPIEGSARREAVGRLLLAVLQEASTFSPDLLSLLSELLPAPTGELLGRLVPLAKPLAARPQEAPLARGTGPVSADAVLGPDGEVAQGFPTYEDRPGQRRMAREIEVILDHGGTLAVEAGPGTGKTFAYLVPAILRLRAQPTARLVVSTRTKSLQEQLFRSDLPFLTARLHPSLSVALLKGRENYACLRRWESVVGESSGGLDRDVLTRLAPFASWLFRTETGDIEENAAFLRDPGGPSLWVRLRDSPRRCPGPLCPYVQDCFSFAARRRARGASLVVVNHSLLLADLRSGREILGDYAYLIVDEAHAFEAATRHAFTSTLAEETVETLLADVEGTAGRRPTGWLSRLSPSQDEAGLERARASLALLRRMNEHLFAALEVALPDEPRGRKPSLAGIAGEAERLGQSLSELSLAIEELGASSGDAEARAEAARLTEALGEVKDLLASLVAPEGENVTHWFKRTDEEVALHASPIEVAPILSAGLYPSLEGLVLTSATLSSGNDFAYLRESLGLDRAPAPVATLSVESPFPYAECMRVYVPRFLPAVDASEDEYAQAVSFLVGEVVRAAERKTLVLFTAHRLLRAVHERLKWDGPALAQGVDGPQTKVLERFRSAEGGAVLLGTDAFWEGVDLPGADLEVLIVTRLPFPVPTDPLLAALGERLESRGQDAFRHLSLPLAVLKLRQGVGRLVRRRTDRGVVILTDGRILSRVYGREFAQSLPVPPRTVETMEGLLADLGAWFSNAGGGPRRAPAPTGEEEGSGFDSCRRRR